jgi:hypothetical protein
MQTTATRVNPSSPLSCLAFCLPPSIVEPVERLPRYLPAFSAALLVHENLTVAGPLGSMEYSPCHVPSSAFLTYLPIYL